MYQALQRLPTLVSALSAHNGCHTPLLSETLTTPLLELQADFEKFLQLVETTVDLDLVDHHEFVIKSSFDKDLSRESQDSVGSAGCIDCMCAELRGEMDDVEAKMQTVFRSAAADLGLEPHKTVRLESTSQLGHFLRVTKKVCVESSQVHLCSVIHVAG